MKKHHTINIILVVIGGLLFIPFLGQVHLFDWDEINFAESAREMILTGDYLTVQIFFEPFWEKPPLFIWFQVLSMKAFGINEFAARFPNAICGILTLLVLFNIGRKIKDIRFGLIWTISYLSALLPFFYFKSGIIDPWFNLFIFLGVYYWVVAVKKTESKEKYLPMVFSATALGLAILTKGPAAALIFGLTAGILFLFNRFRLGVKFMHLLVFFIVFILVGGFWFLLQIVAGNYDTIVAFIEYQIRLFSIQDAGHGGFPMYHFVILLFGVFPASIFLIRAHKRVDGDAEFFAFFRKSMIILFWVVLILFSIVNTKIVHYSSMCYFPMSFLAAYIIDHYLSGKATYRIWISVLLLLIGSVLSLIIIALPVFDMNKEWFIENGYVTHSFTIGNLQANPGFNFTEIGIGLILLLGIILATINLNRKKLVRGFTILAISSIMFIYLSALVITPKAEKYSQNSAIEFFKSMRGKDVYVNSLYKSYAMLFYVDAPIPESPVAFDKYNLADTIVDKPAYFVYRIDKQNEVEEAHPDLELLYEKNGYVFCVKYPPSNKEVKE